MKWHLQRPLRSTKLAHFSRRVAPFSRRLAPTQPYSDDSSSENTEARASDRLFVIKSGAHASMTFLPFPTGRKFSEKIFTFLHSKSKLAQNYIDNMLLRIV